MIRNKTLLFFALMAVSKEDLLKYSESFAHQTDSKIIKKSPVIRFDKISEYYCREMGPIILKQLFLTDKIINCFDLAKYKKLAISTENDNKVHGKRLYNIDPGYINLSQIVLASTKFSPHRLPVDDNIWAEITLLRIDRMWKNLIWTYQDYKTDEFRNFMEEIRPVLKRINKHAK